MLFIYITSAGAFLSAGYCFYLLFAKEALVPENQKRAKRKERKLEKQRKETNDKTLEEAVKKRR